MVTTYGRWIEEKSYTDYPTEKMCDYDYMAIWIREQGYEPKTTMENLITMMFLHFEGDCEDSGEEFTVDGCKQFVRESGGIELFDYEP